MNAKKAAKIIASLRDDSLSVQIGAMPFAEFARAFDSAVADGVEMPAYLTAKRGL